MAKSYTRRGRGIAPKRGYLLERTSPWEIQRDKEAMAEALKVQWDFYSELAFQRKQIDAELRAALTQSATPFKFEKWQRAVRYRFSLHPLSTVGSLTDPGGRFNIGDIAPANFPMFSALYVAADKNTALQETLGQVRPPGSILTAQELALANPQSEAIVSVSGNLETVIDVRTSAVLHRFVDLIKGFTVSPRLSAEAKRLGIPIATATTATLLQQALLEPKWRFFPLQCDVPATSQIFGQLAFFAGIEGIVYPSKLTGKDCVAIFPTNLSSSTGYFALDDPPPHPKVPVRIDSSNWELCEATQEVVLVR